MVSALYRRYRPEAFSELIGQSHVTDPLMAALRTDRVNHAYLFSGPRGCGKTTSARILARCLNCAKGPTDTPCGACPSCVELGRDGGGSMDVIEIDAASHGGVDDARDLRERATLAPNRDRYKIYIIDEAHMVTPSGFNALLKIVEEPPEHVKFIFATTEPEKVIGTIRSRTHHYPFRLIAPAVLLEYVTELSREEDVEVEPGVLPMVIRAGGGSARDTLSLLDQLMAGSDGAITYSRAAALLGFTPSELLDDVTAALASGDAQGAFGAVDRVMQAGQDPRRFVEDLLEHLRDLIIAAVAGDAESILHGVPSDVIERMRERAHEFGPAALSRAADTVAKALGGMSGATSPKLQLELLLARLLVTGEPASPSPASAAPVSNAASKPVRESSTRPSAPAAERAAERNLEREQKPDAAAAAERPEPQRRTSADSRPDVEAAAASFRASASAPAAPESAPQQASAPAQEPTPRQEPTPQPASAAEAQSAPAAAEATTSAPEAQPTPEQAKQPDTAEQPAETTFAQIEDAWPEVLQVIEGSSRRAWMLANALRPVDWDGQRLGLSFRSQADLENFRSGKDGGKPLWIIIAEALTSRFGRKFGFAPRQVLESGSRAEPVSKDQPSSNAEAPAGEPEPPYEPEHEPPYEPEPPVEPAPASATAPRQSGPQEPPTSVASAAGGWAVAAIPQSEPAGAVVDPWADSATPNATNTVNERHDSSPMAEALRNAPPPAEPEELSAAESSRYGESVIREELGAEFIEEITDEGGR